LGHDVRCLDVQWASLRYQHTVAIRARLQERYAPATAKKLLAALRRVLHEAWCLGQIRADDYDRATDLGTIKAERRPRGRLVTDVEMAALLRACAGDPTPAGARDRAIIALLRGTGLRRAEAAALDLANYDPETGGITVQSGRGQKDRIVYAPAGVRAPLDNWLVVRGAAAGPLFYGVVKGGKLFIRRLAGQAMAVICASRALEAGIEPLTPHDLRRTFLSEQSWCQ
jgi:integrase